jgi:hypothetical protein
VTVEYADEEPNGLAAMVGELIEANLRRHPDRRSLLRPALVGLSASDACVSVSIALAADRVSVRNGSSGRGRPHLRVRAESTSLLLLLTASLRLGLPDPFSPSGRQVLGQVLSGRIRISGLVRHPVRAIRLTRLLSVT